jgi:Malectin domain/Secretion system C-terminal sorting domain
MYNATIDINDPFGGNDGVNQAFPEAGSPIQTFSPGFRNAYDVLITQNGRIYTSDNGPNTLWGGIPKIYDIATNTFLGDETTITYNPAIHYIKNELNENGSDFHGDALQYIGTINDANGTYYGGHPNAILAFPSRANIISRDLINGSWVETNNLSLAPLLVGTSGYFNNSFVIGDFPDDSRLGEYLQDEPVGSSRLNILDVLNESTNGIAEYIATDFGGQMQGNILTVSFNGDINRYTLNASGDSVIDYEILFNNFGNIPLDITTQGDSDIFPGTIWAATYGSNSITIFEPSSIDCKQPGDPGYDPLADYDGDGYSNQDEIDNGTNICSQGGKPDDVDGDFISDLNDPDDDNDGIPDLNDVFAIDEFNGLTTNLPLELPFSSFNPGTGFFGVGFTGLMLDPSGTTDYLTQFNKDELSFGGEASKATLELVTGGDAYLTNNNQDYGFQVGVNVDSNSNPFTIHSKLDPPFFGINGTATNPIDFQSFGISCGNGDQDNYFKVVVMNGTLNNDSEYGIQVLLEDQGVITSDNKYDISGILNASSIDLFISIDPSVNTAQPFYSIDNGSTLIILGSPITLPLSFLNSSDNKGLAVGLISTSRSQSSPTPFLATWDLIEVYENQNGVLSINPDPLDFGLTPINNSLRTKYILLNNEGGPTDDVITVTALSFSGTDAASFSSLMSLPFNINPGSSVKVPINFISNSGLGTKNAVLNITHSGNNSPYPSSLTGELTDTYEPIVRINAGGPLTLATDSGPDWEANDITGTVVGTSYIVSSGSSFSISSIDYNNRDASIPNYMDQATYEAMMKSERGIDITSTPMTFSIPVTNGDYIVNFYVGNIYSGTSLPNQRIFSVSMEGVQVISDFDPSAVFGHQVTGMIQNNVTVSDGLLEILFIRNLDNPIVNAIEILGTGATLSNESPAFETVLSVYPNPIKDNKLFIRLDEPAMNLSSIKIYSIQGKLMKTFSEFNAKNNIIPLELSGLSNALYFMTITTNRGNSVFYKLIVQK